MSKLCRDKWKKSTDVHVFYNIFQRTSLYMQYPTTSGLYNIDSLCPSFAGINGRSQLMFMSSIIYFNIGEVVINPEICGSRILGGAERKGRR